MSTRVLWAVLLAIVLAAGAASYYLWTPAAATMAEDCGAEPPPQESFAMASECGDGAAPSSPAAAR
jgi:hypothetical protein